MAGTTRLAALASVFFLAHISLTTASARSTSIYPTNLSSCEASGFCEWKPWDLENKYYPYECVPSRQYITQRLRLNTTQLLAGQCYAWEEDVTNCLQEGTCRYDHNGSAPGCYYPSLQILFEDTTALLDLKPKLKKAAVTEPMECAQFVSNVSCLSSGRHCIWNPGKNFTVTNSANVSELQAVTLDRPLQTGSFAPVVQQIAVKAPAFDRSRMTITRLANQGRQAVGTFRFGLNTGEAGPVSAVLSFNATAAEMNLALSELLATEGGEVDTVEKHELEGFASWLVTFRAGSEVFRERVVLKEVNEVVEEDGASSSTEAHLVLTRHQRNTQLLTIYSPNGLDGGEFLLYYNGVETPQKMSFDASAGEIARQLLSLQVSGVNPLRYVYVEAVDTNEVEPLEAIPPSRSWRITFTTQVMEYEAQESLLEVGFAGQGCAGCTAFTIHGSEANVTTVRADVIALAQSPRVNGTFRAERCVFNKTLNGIGFPQVGQIQVFMFASLPLQEVLLPSPGDYISIGRSLAQVGAIRQESTEPPRLGLRHVYTLDLSSPYAGYEVQDDYGVDVYGCSYIASAPFAPSVSIAQLIEALGQMWPEQEPSDTIEIVKTQALNELNEAQWQVTFLDVVEEIPPLKGVYELAATINPDPAFTAALVVEQIGNADPSGARGSFRLAFAGFRRGAEQNYLPVRLARLDLRARAGCVLNDGQFTQIGCDNSARPFAQEAILACYTPAIAWNASSEEMESALQQLCNLASAPAEAVQVGLNVTQSGRFELRTWEVELALYYPGGFLLEEQEPEARFAQLYVLSKADIEGSGVDINTEKLEPLSGFRFNSSGIEQVFTGDLMQQTPCLINQTYQQELYASPVVMTLFADLDDSLDACSQGDDSFSACGNISVESIQERSFYSEERDFLQLNCVWRGDVPRTNSFSWGPDIYRGRTYRAIESRCTVPLTEVSYVLTQLYFQSGELDNNDIYRDTYDLGVRFLDCGRLIIITPQAVISTEQWYQIIIVTVGICAASYTIAAMRLSYVISDHSLFTPKSFIKIPKLLIFCAASCFYGVITAFAYTCIPALLITQVYNDNRDPDEVLRISISFGCILAIYIIYFELGRGHIMK